MGPTVIRLDEAVVQILEHVRDVCDAARGDDLLLEELTEVVAGGIVRARPTPPYLQVLVGGLVPTQARALHESWQLAVMLTATLHSEDPLDHWNEAIVMAARARSVVLADRTLDDLEFVEDTQSGPVEAMGQTPGQARLFRAYARLNVSFSIVEPQEA